MSDTEWVIICGRVQDTPIPPKHSIASACRECRQPVWMVDGAVECRSEARERGIEHRVVCMQCIAEEVRRDYPPDEAKDILVKIGRGLVVDTEKLGQGDDN